MALLFVVGTPGTGLAATLKSIDQDGLNLRAGPGTTYQAIGGLPAGQSAKVLEEKDGWYRVRTANGLEAWAAGWVSRVNFEDEEAYAVVDTDALNFRQEPNMTGPIMDLLKTGERVRLLEIAGDWWRIRRTSGKEGWVNGKFMKRETTPVTPPPQQPPTTPAQPPTTPAQPPAPPAKPPEAPDTPPPAAPSSSVPVLAALPPLPPGRPAGPKVVRAAVNATVYLGRNTSAFDPVDKVSAGETLKYVDAAEGWVKVTTPRGKTGWISGPNVALTEGKLAYQLKEGAWSLAFGAAAAPTTPAPATPAPTTPAPALPAPASNVIERRVVSDADGLNLRKGPSELAPVIKALPKGEVIDVVDLEMPWISVITQSGLSGWVHVQYTERYTGLAPTAPPAPATPPLADKPVTPPAASTSAGSLKAQLTVLSQGVLQLEVTSTDKPLAEPRTDGNTLVIPALTGETVTAALPVATAGARELALTPAGIALTMDAMPGIQVVEKSPARVVVVLRSTLTAVTARQDLDRTVYEFRVSGPVFPRTKVAGPDVTVEFPGASSAVAGALPPGLRIATAGSTVQAVVSTRNPYSLKRIAGGFELHVYRPGLAGKTIVLDPGHGGPDGGASNKAIGLREADANLGIALRLRAMLAAKGANVLMTRISDVRPVPAAVLAAGPQDDLSHVDLGYRSRIANELKGDAFLSIHNNCCSGSGTETYYTSGILNGERSGALARLIQSELPKGLGQTNRGAFDDLMYVTRTNDVPAVLVEVAFVSHATEGPLLKKSLYQDQAAQLLVKSLERFFAERVD